MAHDLGEEIYAVRMTCAWRIFSLLPLLFFAFELVWNRSLSILLGNRVYVTSITLSTVLARDLMSPIAKESHLKHAIDVVLNYLLKRP